MTFKKHKIGVSGIVFDVKINFNTVFDTCNPQYHWSSEFDLIYIIMMG